MPVPPADTHDRGGTYDEHVSFPLAQEPVELPRPAHRRLTHQSDRRLVDEVKVSAVMIDVIPELVDSPVPSSLTGAMHSANNMPPLVRQMTSEDDLSADNEVVADSKCRDNVVGGPTSTFLKIAGLNVDIAGDVTVGVASSANLAGDVTISVTSSADPAGDVTVNVIPGRPCWRLNRWCVIPG